MGGSCLLPNVSFTICASPSLASRRKQPSRSTAHLPTQAHADPAATQKAWTQGANPVLSRPHSVQCKFMAKSAP